MDSWTIKAVDEVKRIVTVEIKIADFPHTWEEPVIDPETYEPVLDEMGNSVTETRSVEVKGESWTKRFGDCPLDAEKATAHINNYIRDHKAGRVQEAILEANRNEDVKGLQKLVGKKVEAKAVQPV